MKINFQLLTIFTAIVICTVPLALPEPHQTLVNKVVSKCKSYYSEIYTKAKSGFEYLKYNAPKKAIEFIENIKGTIYNLNNRSSKVKLEEEEKTIGQEELEELLKQLSERFGANFEAGQGEEKDEEMSEVKEESKEKEL